MITAGIIGFGYMGRFHLNRTRQVSGIRTVALHDILPEKQQEAEKEGIVFYRQLEELLSLKSLDLIIICTPNNSHAAIAVKALQAGKHVLCEKPAVMNPRELQQVQELAVAQGKLFTIHHNRRWDDDFLAVKQVIEDGTIGDIVTVESRVLGQRGVVYGWRADPACGGGMLYDWGPHLFDQLLQIFRGSRVIQVSAQLRSVLTPAVDDYTRVDIFFDNGVHALVQVGTMALQSLPRWYLYGARGTMKLDGFSAERGGIARIRGEVCGFDSVLGQKALGPSRTMAPLESENLETLPLPKIESSCLAFYKNLVEAIRFKTMPLVLPEDIRRETLLIDTVFKSCAQEQIMKISI